MSEKSIKVAPGSLLDGNDGAIYSRTHGTTAEVYDTPAAWFGKRIRISAFGGAVAMRFGTGDQAVVFATASALATNTLTADATTGFVIGAGEILEYDVAQEDTGFAADGDGAGSRWSAAIISRG